MEYIFNMFFLQVLYILYYIQHFTRIQTHLPQRYAENANGYLWVFIKRRVGLYWARHGTKFGPSNLSTWPYWLDSDVGVTTFEKSNFHRLSVKSCVLLVGV